MNPVASGIERPAAGSSRGGPFNCARIAGSTDDDDTGRSPSRPAGAPRSATASGSSDSGALLRRVNFETINAAALRELPALLVRWLPHGRVNAREYEARNPLRADRHVGSFRVNLQTGRWADFATGDRGGDPVSLAAYLFDTSQIEAARRLAAALGIG